MGETARAWVITLAIALAFACGWWGRGQWDGSSIGVGDSAKQSQEFVTAAVEATTRIDAAEGNADRARERTRERIKYVEVDRGCPPGRGAVSADMRERLRSAFEEAGK